MFSEGVSSFRLLYAFFSLKKRKLLGQQLLAINENFVIVVCKVNNRP